jgi:hypothetical protein
MASERNWRKVIVLKYNAFHDCDNPNHTIVIEMDFDDDDVRIFRIDKDTIMTEEEVKEYVECRLNGLTWDLEYGELLVYYWGLDVPL